MAAAVIREMRAQTSRELWDKNKPLLKDTSDPNKLKSVSRHPACSVYIELQKWQKNLCASVCEAETKSMNMRVNVCLDMTERMK